jgi:hypothetical protein
MGAAIGVVAALPTLGGPFRGAVLLAVLALSALLVLSTLVLVGSPMVAALGLLLSMPVVDIVRKLTNGDPRLLFVRDGSVLVAVVLLTLREPPWRQVVRASREWLLPLAAFIAWFGVAAVNAAAFIDYRLPLAAAKLDFECLPLIGVGWYIARSYQRLRRAAQVLCVVLCAVTGIGIAQAILGPTFLAPHQAIGYFTHLDLLRATTGQTAQNVFQPSSLFVETGRFQNWTFVNFAVGVALLHQRRLQPVARWGVLAVGAAGVFASSGRTVFVASAVLALLVAARRFRLSFRSGLRVALVGGVAIGAVLFAAKNLYPSLYQSRVEFIGRALNFRSSNSEVSARAPAYLKNTLDAIRSGGLVGRGAGTQGLGRQYLGAEAAALTATEGGFASIAYEFGLIGMLLWVTWTVVCCRTMLRYARSTVGDVGESMGTLAFALAVQMFLTFWLGISAFQDFVMNAWFFLICGVVTGVALSRIGGSRAVDSRAETLQLDLDIPPFEIKRRL